jgi:predicted CXXCH cytochrome family protein
MRILLTSLVAAVLLVAATAVVAAPEDAEGQPPSEDAQPAAGDTPAVEPLPEEYSCTFCHADPEMFFDDTANLLVTEKDLINDIHWQKGLRCHDCHGGHAKLEDHVDHRDDDEYYGPRSPAEIPGLCGRCHSSIEYMRRYDPSARTDQESEYWTSGHGLRLKSTPDDPDVATCTSCHGHHDTRAVNEPRSRVYPTRVPGTCAECHSDPEKMKGREYNGKPLGHDQYDEWKKSVHAKMLLEEGDLSAPACNNCHGNHGAVPPDVNSLANTCGTCHVKVATLFAETRMKHEFEQADWEDLPGCAACHGNHMIGHPTDELLGVGDDGLCVRCHGEGEDMYPAALASETAAAMSKGLRDLKEQIADAKKKLDDAERLGMEVREARFDLRKADDALTNARSLVHGFAIEPMKAALDEGIEVAQGAKQDAQEALDQYTYRRIWLAFSLVPILITAGLLLLYIRALPIPGR